MKRLLLILIALMLLMTSFSLAETGTTVYQAGALRLSAYDATDIVQSGEKSEDTALLTIFHNYNDFDRFHDNITVTWDPSIKVFEDSTTPDEYGQNLLDSIISSLQDVGITVDNMQLLSTNLDSGILYVSYTMDADYGGFGLDLVLTLYTKVIVIPVEGDGTYCVEFTADSEAGLLLMDKYEATLETVR